MPKIANGRRYCRKGRSVNRLFVCATAVQSQPLSVAEYLLYYLEQEIELSGMGEDIHRFSVIYGLEGNPIDLKQLVSKLRNVLKILTKECQPCQTFSPSLSATSPEST